MTPLAKLRGSPELVFLIVTDNDLPPWAGIRGDAASLKALLRELPVFEYFLCNHAADWVLFDTHHDVLFLSIG